VAGDAQGDRTAPDARGFRGQPEDIRVRLLPARSGICSVTTCDRAFADSRRVRRRRSRFAETKIEHLMLARPFGGQVGEASDTHTVREPAVDGRVDEIGREERKRDRHVNSLLDRGYGKPVAPVELGNAGEFDHLSDDVNRQCEA
jgi:hypothetical protein